MATKKATTDFSGITGKIIPVDQVPSYHALLVYGRAGTGKTNFGSTLPKPILYLDIQEHGTETISQMKGIDVLRVDDWDELEQVYWYLKSGKSPYKSVVLDQITSLQALAMSKHREKESMSVTDAFTRRDWGMVSGMLQQWLLNYRDLWDNEFNICFLAHERENEADESVDNQIAPNIGARVMPSVASFINGACSIIGNTFIREVFSGENQNKVRSVEYSMRLGPHAFYTTKARRPMGIDIQVPDIMINPTFDKIMAIARGEQPVRKTLKRSNNASPQTSSEESKG